MNSVVELFGSCQTENVWAPWPLPHRRAKDSYIFILLRTCHVISTAVRI